MTLLFWFYRSRMNKGGTVPMMMRITIDGKRISFSTNLFIAPHAWDQNKQKIKGSSPLIREYNNTLLTLSTNAWNALNDASKKNTPIEAKMIRDIITRKSAQAATQVSIVHRHELTKILRIEKPEDSVLLIFYGLVVKVKRYALKLAVSNPLAMAVSTAG